MDFQFQKDKGKCGTMSFAKDTIPITIAHIKELKRTKRETPEAPLQMFTIRLCFKTVTDKNYAMFSLQKVPSQSLTTPAQSLSWSTASLQKRHTR